MLNRYIIFIVIFQTQLLFSCPACFAYGSPDNSVIDGMNSAILFMLIIIFSILIGIALFMYKMYKREDNLS